MGTIPRTIRGVRQMFNLIQGTDIILNSYLVSNPAAFQARTTTIAKMLILLKRQSRTDMEHKRRNQSFCAISVPPYNSWLPCPIPGRNRA